VKDLHTTQGIAHIQHLLDHGHKRTLTGQLVRATYEYLVVESGLPGNLFDWEAADWEKTTTNSWIKTAWKFCSKNNMSIHVPEVHKPKQRRQNNRFIMALAHENGFRQYQLMRINQC